MQYLYNSKGNHIANFANGQLYASGGANIGRYLPTEKIFVDLEGRYLGELVHNDRLMYKIGSSYRSKVFGDQGMRSSAGSFGNPGHQNNIGTITGYEDIPAS